MVTFLKISIFDGKSYFLAVVGLLLLIPLQALPSMSLKSATFDEPLNLGHGIQMLESGDWTGPVDYPPLTRLLAAWTARTFGPPIRYQPDQLPWAPGIYPQLAQTLLYLDNDADALLFWARLPSVFLHVLLALGVFFWSLRLFGRHAALVSLLLASFSPSLLAHGQLVTSDIGVTALSVLSMFFLSVGCDKKSDLPILACGLALGLAMASKYSAVFGIPIAFLALLGDSFLRRPLQRTELSWKLKAFFLAVFTAFLTIWALYGFQYAACPAKDPRLQLKQPLLSRFKAEKTVQSGLQNGILSFLENTRLLPEPYRMGLQFQAHHTEQRLNFFMGQRSIHGHWGYFPVAFLLKTPLALLLLLVCSGLALYRVDRQGLRQDFRARIFVLLAFPCVYFGIAIIANINIGHRHILPIEPFLFVVAGASILGPRTRPQKGLLGGLLLWFVGSSVWIAPDYLAYFNELAGGPKGGMRYLGDSNLDWGQDLRRVRPWMEKNGVKAIKLGYFGTALPAYYGIQFRWLPSVGFLNDQEGTRQIQEGDYLVVSATCLQGFYFQDMSLYDFLKDFEPVDHIGYSLYVYHIKPEHLRHAPSRR